MAATQLPPEREAASATILPVTEHLAAASSPAQLTSPGQASAPAHSLIAPPSLTSSFVRCASVEIRAQLSVLYLALFSLLAVVFPAALLVVCATLLTNLVAAGSRAAEWIGHADVVAIAVACVAALVVGGAAVLWSERSSRRVSAPRLREPVGRDGTVLVECVQKIWRQIGRLDAPPGVRWFANMDIAASASQESAGGELAISAGLWRATVAGEPAANAILAHEIAHIVHGDPRTLRAMARVAVATRAVMLLTTATAVTALVFVTIHETMRLLSMPGALSQVVRPLLLLAVQIIGIGASVLVSIPLGWLAIKRQVAFITSLIEIRADIAAANWTSGLQGFTQALANHERVVQSTAGDFFRALISPALTHIPQRQRLQILRTPALVVSPKVSFFALSLLLAFSVPLNFATPLLFSGSADYLIVLGLAVCLNVTIVMMLLIGLSDSGDAALLPARRRIVLAVASCVVVALPNLDLQPVSYLVMSWFAGFGGEAMDWSTLPHDAQVTGAQLFHETRLILANPWALVSVLAGFASLSVLVRVVIRQRERSAARCVAPVLAVVFASLIACVDDRMPGFLGGASIAEAVKQSGVPHGLLLCLPLVAAALVELLQSAVWPGYADADVHPPAASHTRSG